MTGTSETNPNTAHADSLTGRITSEMLTSATAAGHICKVSPRTTAREETPGTTNRKKTDRRAMPTIAFEETTVTTTDSEDILASVREEVVLLMSSAATEFPRSSLISSPPSTLETNGATASLIVTYNTTNPKGASSSNFGNLEDTLFYIMAAVVCAVLIITVSVAITFRIKKQKKEQAPKLNAQEGENGAVVTSSDSQPAFCQTDLNDNHAKVSSDFAGVSNLGSNLHDVQIVLEHQDYMEEIPLDHLDAPPGENNEKTNSGSTTQSILKPERQARKKKRSVSFLMDFDRKATSTAEEGLAETSTSFKKYLDEAPRQSLLQALIHPSASLTDSYQDNAIPTIILMPAVGESTDTVSNHPIETNLLMPYSDFDNVDNCESVKEDRGFGESLSALQPQQIDRDVEPEQQYTAEKEKVSEPVIADDKAVSVNRLEPECISSVGSATHVAEHPTTASDEDSNVDLRLQAVSEHSEDQTLSETVNSPRASPATDNVPDEANMDDKVIFQGDGLICATVNKANNVANDKNAHYDETDDTQVRKNNRELIVVKSDIHNSPVSLENSDFRQK